MVLVDGHGLPVALSLHEAAKHEVTLVFGLSQKVLTKEKPKRIIGDKAYDSDPLDMKLASVGIEMIAAHRAARKSAHRMAGNYVVRSGVGAWSDILLGCIILGGCLSAMSASQRTTSPLFC